MFVACLHYNTEATWNEYCITRSIPHAPFRIYWRTYRMDGHGMRSDKNYCGYLRGEDGQAMSMGDVILGPAIAHHVASGSRHPGGSPYTVLLRRCPHDSVNCPSS